MKRRLEEFGDLWPAEAKLCGSVHTGHPVFISPSVPDEDAPPEFCIRASFIRYLALGGCEACRPCPKGVRVYGAHIVGDDEEPLAETPGLDFRGAELPGDLWLIRCHVSDRVQMRGAQIASLFLNGSRLLRGLDADSVTARGDVFLRELRAYDEIRLSGASLGGNLDCCDARLTAGSSGWALMADGLSAKGGVLLHDMQAEGEISLLGASLSRALGCDRARLTAGQSGYALAADRLAAKGGVFLRDLQAEGEVRLLGASLGGNFECNGASLTAAGPGSALGADGLTTKGGVFLDGLKAEGEVCLSGASLGGSLDCTGARLTAGRSGVALSADKLDLRGTFFLRNGAAVTGQAHLAGAEVGVLSDDLACWPGQGDLVLDGFRYGAISGKSLTAQDRLGWLAKQDPARFGADFWPQPYEQLAKVFREMGHRDDARAVLVAKERLQRTDRRRRLRSQKLFEDAYIAGVWDRILGATVGYGQRPLRASLWLGLFWLLGAGMFGAAFTADTIKPNNALVLRSAEWTGCAMGQAGPAPGIDTASAAAPPARWSPKFRSQLACFLDQPEAASYPGFNHYVYSADTLLPVVDLEMQAFWIPDDRTGFGWWARVYLWLHIALGWALSLLAVAGFSGLIKSD